MGVWLEGNMSFEKLYAQDRIRGWDESTVLDDEALNLF